MSNSNIIPVQFQNPSTGQQFAKIVYVNSTDPTTATIFDLDSPPTTTTIGTSYGGSFYLQGLHRTNPEWIQ